MARTKFPVVLIHGVFGFGKQRPLFGHWVPYWPEKELEQTNPNHILVDVGSVSSDHDRACEVFYQLMGGRHERYGETFSTPLHPNWSADNPVHLLGHSFGSTTAIELFQMLSADYFGVGSSYKWVKSITCIAGPLTGSTLTHMIGMNGEKVVPFGVVHVMSIVFGSWIKLCSRFPVLKNVADLHMNHWSKYPIKAILNPNGPVSTSKDLVIHGTLPEHRVTRNAQLQHMEKLHLLSITTSPKTVHIPIGEGVATVVLLLLRMGKFPKWWPAIGKSPSFRAFAALLIVGYLYSKLKQLDVSKMPTMYGLKWLIRRRARSLPMIFKGFEADSWGHNDGVVNIRSMLRPWFPSPQEMEQEINSQQKITKPRAATLPATPSSSSLKEVSRTLARCESHISIDGFHRDTDDEQQSTVSILFEKGRWYVYRVDSNHLAGTYWDSNAVNLYKSLFTLMSKEYEREDRLAASNDDDRQNYHHNSDNTNSFYD
ncbi:hypothetical protein PHYBOEH_007429 [Phytophthora boehmeriae]|uniref:Lipase-like C-terminal domain-containing protein n=1 Tax=Phytophthora boehmeriae TaxID=109152 RepID=A0A8T1W855_9STRA|nr:hypothetical protein PHYBOEH_007429 [Phytophthora boehmeriae]